VDGRCWTGEIVDLINLDVERKRHVVTSQLKMLVTQEMLDICSATGKKIVDTKDISTLLKEPLAKV
jgi:hypothetical protein